MIPPYCEWCGKSKCSHEKPCTHVPEIDVDDIDGDETYLIKDLIGILQGMLKKYGRGSFIRFDAGHNNVSVRVVCDE